MATLRDIVQGRSIPPVTRAMVATTVALSLVAIVAQLYQKPIPIGSGREPRLMLSPASETASGVTFLCLLAAYAGSQRLAYLYDTSIHGLFGVVSGLTVAFKQAIPEHRVVLGHRSWLAFRVNYLTFIYVPITAMILCLLGQYPYACLVVFGTIAAWVYLRFVKDYNGTRGDLSDAFAFATFFPDPVQPPIRWLCEHIFRFMVWCHILRPMPAYNPYSVENGVLPTPSLSVLGDEQSEAERRRALAMKAVDLRLNANESTLKHDTS
ncbi:hypothetical protein H4R35_003656 [Dimargaris xerosporica]|nr:hypothetical protein H4R35_003656 [Dimargaris xerosporica]